MVTDSGDSKAGQLRLSTELFAPRGQNIGSPKSAWWQPEMCQKCVNSGRFVGGRVSCGDHFKNKL